jgi:chromosome segregation ATPase
LQETLAKRSLVEVQGEVEKWRGTNEELLAQVQEEREELAALQQQAEAARALHSTKQQELSRLENALADRTVHISTIEEQIAEAQQTLTEQQRLAKAAANDRGALEVQLETLYGALAATESSLASKQDEHLAAEEAIQKDIVQRQEVVANIFHLRQELADLENYVNMARTQRENEDAHKHGRLSKVWYGWLFFCHVT